MALKKLNTGSPYNNIRKWLREKTKSFAPNPLKPAKRKTTKEKKSNYNSLAEIINATHKPTGLINQIVDEIKDLIERVTTNEEDIDKLEDRTTKLEERVSDIERYNSNRKNIYDKDRRSDVKDHKKLSADFKKFTTVGDIN